MASDLVGKGNSEVKLWAYSLVTHALSLLVNAATLVLDISIELDHKGQHCFSVLAANQSAASIHCNLLTGIGSSYPIAMTGGGLDGRTQLDDRRKTQLSDTSAMLDGIGCIGPRTSCRDLDRFQAALIMPARHGTRFCRTTVLALD
jgi:hypothetical protein